MFCQKSRGLLMAEENMDNVKTTENPPPLEKTIMDLTSIHGLIKNNLEVNQ